LLDLGSGGGFDVFIAGRKVGPTGRAVGFDMTAEMLCKARNNIANTARAPASTTSSFASARFNACPLPMRAWTL
jgi:ubiquinone/menaquinone biosynthesis C-methylase UbiE